MQRLSHHISHATPRASTLWCLSTGPSQTGVQGLQPTRATPGLHAQSCPSIRAARHLLLPPRPACLLPPVAAPQEVSSLGRPQPERLTRKEQARLAAMQAQQGDRPTADAGVAPADAPPEAIAPAEEAPPEVCVCVCALPLRPPGLTVQPVTCSACVHACPADGPL